MLVCERLQKRLDDAWYLMQKTLHAKYPCISQIDLDEMCTCMLENLAKKYASQSGQSQFHDLAYEDSLRDNL